MEHGFVRVSGETGKTREIGKDVFSIWDRAEALNATGPVRTRTGQDSRCLKVAFASNHRLATSQGGVTVTETRAIESQRHRRISVRILRTPIMKSINYLLKSQGMNLSVDNQVLHAPDAYLVSVQSRLIHRELLERLLKATMEMS